VPDKFAALRNTPFYTYFGGFIVGLGFTKLAGKLFWYF
jgi:hypothetical protein